LGTPTSDNLSRLYNRLDKRVSLLSGFQLTIIVLIVLPSAVIISHYFLTEVVINYFKSISTVDTVSENIEYATLAVNLFSTHVSDSSLCGHGINLSTIPSTVFN
jgi:hypothetical protein